jgi:hypothetical protein
MQRDAAARLGISERTLHRWRSAGLLQAGEHWRRKFPNPNSPLLYHLERCEATMSEAAARHPGRLEVAPLCSSQRRSRPLEVAPTAGLAALRSPSLPPSAHRSPQGEAGEDGEALADGGIDAAAGTVAEHLGGIEGQRPRARLRRGRLAG